MTNKEKPTEKVDWEDFSVSVSPASATKLYESYKVFKSRFASLPKAELLRRGWVDENKDSTILTDFFTDIHAEHGTALFRKVATADAALCSLWLSKVKSVAEIDIFTRRIPRFEQVSKEDLKSIAQLSVDVDVITKLPDILAERGISLIYNRALPAMKLDGAVFKLASGNPVIGMSIRFSRLDNFWFTLLHELAHIHLHMDMLDLPILEDLELQSEEEIEISANRLAKNSFVDRVTWRNCKPKYDTSIRVLEEFAAQVNIHKSVIAGMLRKETGNFQVYSKLVNDIDVRKLVFQDG